MADADVEKYLWELMRSANWVHLNMLRGTIARPTPAQIGHLYRGDEALEVIEELKRQNQIED